MTAFRFATAQEQAALTALGADLLTRVREFIEQARIVTGEISDERRSQEVGRIVIHAINAAGNDVEWLNRVYVVQGIGVAIGETFAAYPAVASGMAAGLERGVDAGFRRAKPAFEPKGRA